MQDCSFLHCVRTRIRGALRGTVFAASMAVWAGSAAADPADDAAFLQVMEDHWAETLQQNPVFATSVGVHTYDDRLGSLSLEDHEENGAAMRALYERLRAIDITDLSEEHRLNYELLTAELQDAVAALRHKGHLLTITNRGGWHLSLARLPNTHPFFKPADFETYIARLRDFPRLNKEGMARLTAAIQEGYVQPCAPMEGYEATIAAHTVPVEESVFLAPLERLPATMPDSQKAEIERDLRAAIGEAVIPAMELLLDFYTGQYAPNCREEVGISSVPDGGPYYAYLARHFTTTDLTPKEIHELGKQEVARIRTEMEAVIERAEFDGNFEAFLDFLRTDDRFYAKTPEELETYVAALAKRIDGEMPRLFGHLPRLPYTVKPVPADIAEKTTVAYYERGSEATGRPGVYRINTTKLESRPLYTMPALTVHEAVPGHHLQIAISQELDLPPFRRYGGPTAFVEGWGLYSERLGIEMGLYDDPYDDFGRLSYEMWRACRLVVDTGMHAFGWSRQEAIDFMAANTALSLHNVTAEIDRYITWPGQALAYKVGELRIRELRSQAEKALGEDFDIRAFHDVVLGSGAIPLSVLERIVTDWIAKQDV